MTRPVKLQVSFTPDLDRALRLFLADQGRSKKGGLSDFVAELVRTHLTQWVRSRDGDVRDGVADPATPDHTLPAVVGPAPSPVDVQAVRATSAPSPSRRHAPPAATPPAPAAAAAAPASAPMLSDADLVRLMNEAVRWGHAASRQP